MSKVTGGWKLETNLGGSILADSRECIRQDLSKNVSKVSSTLLLGTLTETSTMLLYEVPRKIAIE